MSSKGTRRVTVRLPEELLEEVEGAIDRSITMRAKGGLTLSDYIRIALVEKLAKANRSSKRDLHFLPTTWAEDEASGSPRLRSFRDSEGDG